jgi:hypothetical protein
MIPEVESDKDKVRWQGREHTVHPPAMKNDPKGKITFFSFYSSFFN